MSYNNTKSATNVAGRVAPEGYHYMPDGSLMSDIEHARIYNPYVIKDFILDLSDLAAGGEKRDFVVVGDRNAQFILEIKDYDTGKYYNFYTREFQTAKYSLEHTIQNNNYKDSITFPAITGGTDQYDIYLYAVPGTIHSKYVEVRFGDGSIDKNSSRGSNSLMMQKVIYQYTALSLSIGKLDLAGAIVTNQSGHSNASITVDRGKNTGKIPFEVVGVCGTTQAFQILKVPQSSDILARGNATIGDAPETIPGENIYPAVTGTDTVNGAISTGGGAPYTVTMDSAVASKMAVGDRITGNADLNAATVTVVALTGTNTFTMSEDVAIADGITLSFSNQKNYQWPVDNTNQFGKGIIVRDNGIVSGTTVAKYQETVYRFEGTDLEEEIIVEERDYIDTEGQEPTIVNGLVTAQPGNVLFNQQQPLAIAGAAVSTLGYGTAYIETLSGFKVKFTDLTIALTPVTTTVVNDVINSTSVVVAERAGILDNVSTVTGIGIDKSTAVPTVSSGAGAVDGQGTIVLSAAQNLESGTTLTFTGASRTVTITGNVEVLKAGTSGATLYFDVARLISMT